MIREIPHRNSLYDFWVNDLKMSGNESNDVGASEYVFVASICPKCGQQQFKKWSLSGLNYHVGVDENDIDVDDDTGDRIGSVVILYKKMFEELNDYIENAFHCITCGESLSFEPGYFYSSSRLYIGDLLDGGEGLSKCRLPYGYKWIESSSGVRNICFDGYHNASLCKEKSDYANHKDVFGLVNDEGVYDGNPISKEYLSSNPAIVTTDDLYGRITFLTDKGKCAYKELCNTQLFELMSFYRECDVLYEDRILSLIAEEKGRLGDSLDVEPIREELSLDQIKEVLKEMIGFETLIISLQSRLKSLYLVKERENSKYFSTSTQKEEDDVENLNKKIQELVAERERLSSAALDTGEFVRRISESKPKLNYPTEPNKPVEPQYEKAGLFNKKKVEADNAAKKQQYDADLASYNAALSEYNRLVIEVQKMEKEQNEEIRQEAMLLAQENRKKELDSIDSQIKDCETKIETAKIEISRKEKEIQAAKDSLSELPWNKEFDQAVELLKKTLETKTIYEKSEIIFPKYQDLVCYSQFYEYFQAGRCTSLTGPDGAYNLYENELKQSIIIGKLDDITNSLEEIKQNQFMIYSELKSINSNISKLDDSMNKILGKVTEIGTNVEAIRNSTEIIEENSKIAAYYSKKNAELTNAMGYLVALK